MHTGGASLFFHMEIDFLDVPGEWGKEHYRDGVARRGDDHLLVKLPVLYPSHVPLATRCAVLDTAATCDFHPLPGDKPYVQVDVRACFPGLDPGDIEDAGGIELAC